MRYDGIGSRRLVIFLAIALLLSGCSLGGSRGNTSTFPDVAGVTERVKPATVLILNIGGAGGGAFPGQPGGAVEQGSGTGFLYDSSGYIITNDHVITGATQLKVVFPPPDNREFEARLVGTDPPTDLALLKIEGQNLPTVSLADPARLRVGEWVVAIGNALSLPGGPTVTAGVISAIGRDVEQPGWAGQPPIVLYDLLQTDAAINPGNSGGPLINMRGEVVGVNTLGSIDYQNINFAVSLGTTKRVIEQLRQSGRVSRGYLGGQFRSVTPAIAASLRLPRNEGVVATRLMPGTPAADAGLQPGDVIIGIGDVPVLSQVDLQRALTEQFKPGQTVTLKIVRGGDEQLLTVVLGEWPGP